MHVSFQPGFCTRFWFKSILQVGNGDWNLCRRGNWSLLFSANRLELRGKKDTEEIVIWQCTMRHRFKSSSIDF